MQRPKKKAKLYPFLSGLLLLISLSLLAANPLYQYTTTQKVKNNLKTVSLAEITPVVVAAATTAEMDYSNDGVYIGKVAIPAVDLALPIVKGIGDDNLYLGAATNLTNQVLGQGNYPLSAHKMPFDQNLLFSPLLRVKIGDLIHLTDGEQLFTYQTTETFVVGPEQVEILDVIPNKTVVTLYTCETDAGTERHVVRGELQSISSLADADSAIYDLLQ